jgi:hypothetical protein
MKKYYSLMHLGINAYAFPKQQALIIISKLKEKKHTHFRRRCVLLEK